MGRLATRRRSRTPEPGRKKGNESSSVRSRSDSQSRSRSPSPGPSDRRSPVRRSLSQSGSTGTFRIPKRTGSVSGAKAPATQEEYNRLMGVVDVGDHGKPGSWLRKAYEAQKSKAATNKKERQRGSDGESDEREADAEAAAADEPQPTSEQIFRQERLPSQAEVAHGAFVDPIKSWKTITPGESKIPGWDKSLLADNESAAADPEEAPSPVRMDFSISQYLTHFESEQAAEETEEYEFIFDRKKKMTDTTSYMRIKKSVYRDVTRRNRSPPARGGGRGRGRGGRGRGGRSAGGRGRSPPPRSRSPRGGRAGRMKRENRSRSRSGSPCGERGKKRNASGGSAGSSTEKNSIDSSPDQYRERRERERNRRREAAESKRERRRSPHTSNHASPHSAATVTAATELLTVKSELNSERVGRRLSRTSDGEEHVAVAAADRFSTTEEISERSNSGGAAAAAAAAAVATARRLSAADSGKRESRNEVGAPLAKGESRRHSGEEHRPRNSSRRDLRDGRESCSREATKQSGVDASGRRESRDDDRPGQQGKDNSRGECGGQSDANAPPPDGGGTRVNAHEDAQRRPQSKRQGSQATPPPPPPPRTTNSEDQRQDHPLAKGQNYLKPHPTTSNVCRENPSTSDNRDHTTTRDDRNRRTTNPPPHATIPQSLPVNTTAPGSVFSTREIAQPQEQEQERAAASAALASAKQQLDAFGEPKTFLQHKEKKRLKEKIQALEMANR